MAEGHLADFYRYTSADTVIAFHLNAATRVEWKRSRRYTRFLSEAGSLTIIPAGEENEFRTDRWSRWLIWAIDQDQLQSLAEREWEPRGSRVEILETFNNRGAELWTLGHGWPNESAHRSLGRASTPNRSARRSPSTCSGTIRLDPTGRGGGGTSDRFPDPPGRRVHPCLARE